MVAGARRYEGAARLLCMAAAGRQIRKGKIAGGILSCRPGEQAREAVQSRDVRIELAGEGLAPDTKHGACEAEDGEGVSGSARIDFGRDVAGQGSRCEIEVQVYRPPDSPRVVDVASRLAQSFRRIACQQAAIAGRPGGRDRRCGRWYRDGHYAKRIAGRPLNERHVRAVIGRKRSGRTRRRPARHRAMAKLPTSWPRRAALSHRCWMRHRTAT